MRTPRSARPAQKGKSGRRVLATAAVVAAVAVAAWLMLARRPATTVPAAPPPPAPLPYERLVALTAEVESLQAHQRFGECLPAARTLLEQHALRDRVTSDMLVQYAGQLNCAAYEVGPGAPRSSLERVRFEQQALAACRQALDLAQTPQERAQALTIEALVHDLWGFPSDAEVLYRQALSTDPACADARRMYGTFLRRIRVAPRGASGGE